MNVWQLQDAKNRFSRLFNEVLLHGPQVVTRRGRDEVVLLSKSKYTDLAKEKKTVADVLRAAPKVDLDLSRSKESVRDIEL